MFSGITAGVMNGLKRFCGIHNMVPKLENQNFSYIDQNSHINENLDQFLRKPNYIDEQNLEDGNNNDNYVEQNVQTTENDDVTNSWENLIIPEICTYSEMRGPFYDVLHAFDYIGENREVYKHFENDKLNVTIQHCNTVHQNQPNAWGVKIESKSKILDMFKPYTVVDNGRKFGLRIEPNYNISGDFGISQTFCNKSISTNKLYTSARYTLSSMVMDAEFELSRHAKSQATLFNMQMSPVFGHRFNEFGLMAGLNFKMSNSPDFELKNICDGVTFGLVSPVAAGQLTVKPSDTECEFNAYWKVSNRLEVAGSFKSHLRHPEWRPYNQEIGMKYKCSDQISYGIKTDLSGNISAGLSLLIGKSMRIKYCFQPKIMQEGEVNNIGFSLEF